MALAVLTLALVSERTAKAENHRVAAVDPDEELARALDVALLPWGAEVIDVHLDHPGAVANLPVDRARTIAAQTHADVVMWVSHGKSHYEAWIYDVASDQASLRELASAPPFDATTAAAVALSVKALLRFTVVAPPPERFGAAPFEPTWAFGVSASFAVHFGDFIKPEARSSLLAAYWPSALHHRWGALLGISYGQGVHFDTTYPGSSSTSGAFNVFSGELQDIAARVAIGVRAPLRPWAAFEASMGLGAHMFTMTYRNGPTTMLPGQASRTDFSPAFEPQVAVDMTVLGGFIRLAPWFGLELLATPHVYFNTAETVEVAEAARLTMEGGLRAEFVLP